jgi:NAD(P)-dependent dehydrogenase (short-subunit alcohol dehydrogenase family)
LLSISDINADELAVTLSLLTTPDSDAPAHLATQVDVTSAAAVNEWIQSTTMHFGRLDHAANIAGIHLIRPIPIRTSTDAEWTQVLDINATGVFFCLRAQLNAMLGHGSIVNVASIAGHVGLAGSSAYCASKHAVIGLTKAAAREEGEGGIRVNCIAPGMIMTYCLLSSGDSVTRWDAD